jgi:hypothetical protein
MEAIRRDSQHFLTESAESTEKRLSQKAAQAAFFLLGNRALREKAAVRHSFGE